MKKMEKFVDEFGCIVQGPPLRDGGDGGHRMGAYHCGIGVRVQLMKMPDLLDWWKPLAHEFKSYVRDNLQNAKGQLRRHPHPVRWYGRWNCASRDLTIALLCGCAMTGSKSIARKYIKSHIFNWGMIGRIGHKVLPFRLPVWLPLLVAGNWLRNHVERDADFPPEEQWKLKTKIPDPTLLEVWALEIRAARLWMLYPLLLVLDLETFIGTLVWNKWRKDDNDIINHVYVTNTIQHIYPTPLGYLAHRMLNWPMASNKFWVYFSQHPENITEMHDLWKPVFDHYIKKYGQNS